MKSKILLSLAAFALVFTSFTATADAGGWRRVRTSCGYTYQRVVQQPAQITQRTETQTTVINNLVGIPVPVNYSQPIAAQGSTVYGYSANTQQYGSLDMALLYNQAARLTDQAQQLAGQAASDFSTLVQAEGQNQAEVARIIAQGQSARQALQAASGQRVQASIQQQTFAFRVTQGSDGQLKVEQIQTGSTTGSIGNSTTGQQNFNLSEAQGATTNVSDLLKNRCVSCHGNTEAQGGLNLEVAITDEQQASILARVTSDDLDKRMPRNSDDTAGQKLNMGELRLLFNAMGSQK